MQLLRNLLALPRRLTDAIFGYDFFISYSHADGLEYPRELDEFLRNKFSVHLDTRDYHAGEDLRILTRVRVRNSRFLVVICRPFALTRSTWVRREVEIFSRLGREPILINVDGAIEAATADPPRNSLAEWIVGRMETDRDGNLIDPFLRETDEVNEHDGPRFPEPHILHRLEERFTGDRVETRRLRLVSTAVVLLLMAFIVAIWQFLAADSERAIAERRAQQLEVESANLHVSLAESEIAEGRNSEAIARLLFANSTLGFIDSNTSPIAPSARNALSLALVGQTEVARFAGEWSTAFLHSGILYLGNKQGEIHLFEANSLTHIQNLKLGNTEILKIQTSRNGMVIGALTRDAIYIRRGPRESAEKNLGIWQVADTEFIDFSLSENGDRFIVYGINATERRSYLLTGRADRETLSEMTEFCGQGSELSSDGKKIGVVGHGQEVQISMLETGEVVFRKSLNPGRPTRDLDFSCFGNDLSGNIETKCVAFSDDLERVNVWTSYSKLTNVELKTEDNAQPASGLFSQFFSGEAEQPIYFNCNISSSPSGRTIVVSPRDNAWRIFNTTMGEVDVKTTEPLATFQISGQQEGWGRASVEPTNPPRDVILLDDNLLISIHQGHASLHRYRAEEKRFKLHSGPIFVFDLSANGKILAAAALDGSVVIADTETGAALYKGLPFGRIEIPQRAYLYSGLEILSIDVGENISSAVAISNDGKNVLISTFDGEVFSMRFEETRDGDGQAKLELRESKGIEIGQCFSGPELVQVGSTTTLIVCLDPWTIGVYQAEVGMVTQTVTLHDTSGAPSFAEVDFRYEFDPSDGIITVAGTLVDHDIIPEIPVGGPIQKMSFSDNSERHDEIGPFRIVEGPTVLPGVWIDDEELLVSKTRSADPNSNSEVTMYIREFRANGNNPALAMRIAKSQNSVWFSSAEGELVEYSLDFLEGSLKQTACNFLPAMSASTLEAFLSNLGDDLSVDCNSN